MSATVAELGIPRRRLYRLIEAGVVRHRRIGRAILLDLGEVIEDIDRHTVDRRAEDEADR